MMNDNKKNNKKNRNNSNTDTSYISIVVARRIPKIIDKEY